MDSSKRLGGTFRWHDAPRVQRVQVWPADKRPHGLNVPPTVRGELRQLRLHGYKDVYTPLDESWYPPDHRPRTQLVTACTSQGTWLVGRSRADELGAYTTPIARRDRKGEPAPGLQLPHRTYLVQNQVIHDVIVTMSHELEVRAYSYDGKLVFAADLGSCPGVQDLFDSARWPTENRYYLRAVVVSPALDRLVFSVLDHVFCYTLDGRGVFAVQLPPEPHPWWGLLPDAHLPQDELKAELAAAGLDAESTMRQIVDFLNVSGVIQLPVAGDPVISQTYSIDQFHDLPVRDLTMTSATLRLATHALGTCERDWVYHLYLTDCGELYVSMKSGLFVRLASDGTLVESWELPDSVEAVTVIDGVVYGICWGDVWRMRHGAEPEPVTASRWSSGDGNRRSFMWDRYAAMATKRHLNVVRLETAEQNQWSTRRDIRAVYPTGRGLRVETTTTAAHVTVG